MKNVTTGLGLCVLGVGIAAYPVLDHLVPRADAGAPGGGGAIVAAATGQVEPTVVWYGVGARPWGGNNYGTANYPYDVLYRAWSDGRIEARKICTGNYCGDALSVSTPWVVVSDPNTGYNAASDINFDSKVDGADLGQLLTAWGDAPRNDIPPSDCPLNLINP